MLKIAHSRHRTKLRFGELYIYIFLFLLLAVSESEALTNYGVVIPYFRFNPSFIIVIFGLIGLFVVVLTKKIRLDIITVILALRIIISILPIIREQGNVHSSYFGNFVMCCIPLLAYLIFVNTNINFIKAFNALILFGFIVSLQCVLAYFIILYKGYATYGALYYKNYFVIPAGATNNVSAILIPLLILGDQVIEKKIKRLCYIFLLVIGIFLTKSRTGMILCTIYFICKLLILKKGKKVIDKKVLILISPIFSLFLIIIFFNTNIGKNIQKLMLGYSSPGKGINALFSGRFSVYAKTVKNIANYPFIGNGLTYEKMNFMKPHNIFLQILFENGLLGFFGLIIFFSYVVVSVYKYKNMDKYIYAFSQIIPLIILNALFEDIMLTNFMILFGTIFLAYMEKNKNEWRKIKMNGGK